ncbi:hypothetical protein PENTCL1PPCAC_4364, partial [Pristionchus entomophagus]
YGYYPYLILQELIKPTKPVSWYTLDAPDGKRSHCGSGRNPPQGQQPTRNGDDPNAKCYSNGGYCGATNEHCESTGWIDFPKKKEFVFKPVEWWTYANGPENIGKCGPMAPLLPRAARPSATLIQPGHAARAPAIAASARRTVVAPAASTTVP